MTLGGESFVFNRMISRNSRGREWTEEEEVDGLLRVKGEETIRFDGKKAQEGQEALGRNLGGRKVRGKRRNFLAKWNRDQEVLPNRGGGP